MRVDRSQSGEYASPKLIRITHHTVRACGVALSIFNHFSEHASLFTHHASRITRMWICAYMIHIPPPPPLNIDRIKHIAKKTNISQHLDPWKHS